MAKYSTDSDSGADPDRDGASCTMCGDVENLTTGEISGREVVLCRSCKSGDSSRSSTEDSGETTSTKEKYDYDDSTENSSDSESGGYTITNPDSSWVEESRPDYGDSDTPYLLPNYANKLETLMDERDLSVKDIEEKTGLERNIVKSVVEGNAISDDITVGMIEVFEDKLGITLQEKR